MTLEKVKVVIPSKHNKLSEYYLEYSNMLAYNNQLWDLCQHENDINYFNPLYIQAVEELNDYLTIHSLINEKYVLSSDDIKNLEELKKDPNLKSYLCEIQEIPKVLKNYIKFKETKDGEYYYIDYDIKSFIWDYYDKYDKNDKYGPVESYEDLMELFRIMTKYY